MNTLILKLNATGDVVRTTPLLSRLTGDVTWITASRNLPLLDGLRPNLRCCAWEDRESVRDRTYDLVLNLEDEQEIAAFVESVSHRQKFGACLNGNGRVGYTDDARQWFDLSLISVHGRQRADQLKYENRRSYQEMIFESLGFGFTGERYIMPQPASTDLCGDIAIAPVAGPVWPMKNWAYYEPLKQALESRGLRVNVLPRRDSLLEHLGDVANHRCLVGGDSLPMHLALGAGVGCVILFNCTSPWEIYDYGLLTKLISPRLGEFFYKRGFDEKATTAISLEETLAAVLNRLAKPVQAPSA